MKKVLLILLVSTLALFSHAQSTQNENYYKGIETYRDLQLSSEQIAKIKQLKKEVGPKFEAIGLDRSLSGYEKGQKKRELALKHKQEIESILTKEQIGLWEKKHGQYTSLDNVRKGVSDGYDSKADALEDKYDAEKSAIENNTSLSKDEKKVQKEALKQKYKAEKDKLKAEKEHAKNEML
ncbi:hypothetical protein GGR21_003069 [Dysgonomonas hofstadii]|uniref:Uncharacterized protein n=1 Tax=Dysgonomonas hofstadii TaxID=637886 RepID=A0A840CTY0_9BACT|nr:hypothetical protein [Dysgonomonas hofstadii]MBB4037154.1 hypothetical protein [Dysgonomonas hofstadii]